MTLMYIMEASAFPPLGSWQSVVGGSQHRSEHTYSGLH